MATTPSPAPAPVLLVGHCGPDSSYLRMAVQRALPAHPIKSVHDWSALDKELAVAPAILLINRVLEPGFETENGVELVGDVRRKYPAITTVLVSNFPEAQAAAIKQGARPGFGKSDLGTTKLTALLQDLAK